MASGGHRRVDPSSEDRELPEYRRRVAPYSSLLDAMRIRFETEGGIGNYPGSPARRAPIVVNTNDLPPSEIRKLDRLLEEAGLFDLPAVSTPPRGAADYIRYTISITAPGYSHKVTFTDPIEDPHVGALVDYLENARG